ncbi:MAG: hypothetical protein ABF490_10275 [Lentilactobacillus hilgardii]|nr:hypothetical protein [Lentilactobacillus hilgardii]MBZ2202583.1 hypothetical protein [Lentilactobacillus hilgardii]MBZ2205547.1 hypothetical protein [Lentilactobacillus hilgardii]
MGNWKKVLLVALSAILFMTLSFNTKAATSTVPKAMRGNWYFYDYTMRHYYFTKHRIRYDINQKGDRPPFVHSGYAKIKLKGYHIKRLRWYSIDIDFEYFPCKLKVAGKYRHVLLSTMEQGHSFAIYTHFMPARTYKIPAKILR